MDKDNKLPLVSVIITTYNRNKYLEECLVSIVNQTYNNIEVFVIDDGSDADIAKKNKELCRGFLKCKYYYKKNTGQPDSRNFGINKAKGLYIAFCDDDDLWILDKLEKQVHILEKNIEYGLVTGNTENIQANGNKTGRIKSHRGNNHGYIFKDLLIKNRTASIIPLVRKEVFDKVGLFDPNYTIAEDWDFWRRVSYYYKFYNIDETLAYVRAHDNNMTRLGKFNPLGNFILYRKLTKSLLSWGNGKFNDSELNLIYEIEWLHYRKILVNHYTSSFKKVNFLYQVALNNFKDAIHFMYLYLKFEILK